MQLLPQFGTNYLSLLKPMPQILWLQPLLGNMTYEWISAPERYLLVRADTDQLRKVVR